MRKIFKVISLLTILTLLATSFVGCASNSEKTNSGSGKDEKQIVIGFSMDTLKEERCKRIEIYLLQKLKN